MSIADDLRYVYKGMTPIIFFKSLAPPDPATDSVYVYIIFRSKLPDGLPTRDIGGDDFLPKLGRILLVFHKKI